VIREPAYFQMAKEMGILEHSLIRNMHYAGAPENRNIHGVEGKGTFMFVTEGGKRTAINKHVGFDDSVRRVAEVKAVPDVKRTLKADDVVPSQKELVRIHETVHFSKGEFPGRRSIKLPPHKPVFASWASLTDQLFTGLQHTTFRHADKALLPVAIEFSRRFCFFDDRWFAGSGALNDAMSVEEIFRTKQAMRWKSCDPSARRDFKSTPIPLHPAQERKECLGWELVYDHERIAFHIANTLNELCKEVALMCEGQMRVLSGQALKDATYRRDMCKDLQDMQYDMLSISVGEAMARLSA
jgi:hypothetical protein